MAKVKQNKKKTMDDKLTLQDTLNQDILLNLKQAQLDLKNEEEKQKILAEERKREERRNREKNKSFEELLDESTMDWKNFK